MKIKKITEKDNVIEIETDNTDRPIFVYPKDTFDNLSQLQVEIDKSIINEGKRKDKKEKKLKKIKEEFNNAGN